MIKYTVRLNGVPVKDFVVKEDAHKYMVYLTQWQSSQNLVHELIEGALATSDLKESKEVIKHIMELK
jgi:hypothetical protein